MDSHSERERPVVTEQSLSRVVERSRRHVDGLTLRKGDAGNDRKGSEWVGEMIPEACGWTHTPKGRCL